MHVIVDMRVCVCSSKASIQEEKTEAIFKRKVRQLMGNFFKQYTLNRQQQGTLN